MKKLQYMVLRTFSFVRQVLLILSITYVNPHRSDCCFAALVPALPKASIDTSTIDDSVAADAETSLVELEFDPTKKEMRLMFVIPDSPTKRSLKGSYSIYKGGPTAFAPEGSPTCASFITTF